MQTNIKLTVYDKATLILRNTGFSAVHKLTGSISNINILSRSGSRGLTKCQDSACEFKQEIKIRLKEENHHKTKGLFTKYT